MPDAEPGKRDTGGGPDTAVCQPTTGRQHLREEPDALTAHVQICAGGPQQWGLLPRSEAGGVGAALYRPPVSRGEALPGALDRGAGERTAQGRVWRAVPEGSRPWQGVVPPDVRHSRADGRAVDAPDAISRSRWIPDNAG